ncbi:hypothetical protein DFH08DRAFT_268384 [Mycena albidolilacea]|uniref:Trichothecene 3-O-acetyltransferase-like N-terminal domain-containing protein n=1 Tax=Mycena albidolilacea TaxID=1033008 RepID=A0AAD7ANX8_9AGAR|nr:hypothetical protein DFH08DRAFT_268384 [Mycena albidolilacea]
MANTSFNDSVFIPGPSFHVDLPPLDARHMFHFSRRLLFFRCSSSDQRDAQLAAFKAGIKALLLRCPVLGGDVTPLPADKATEVTQDWRTIVPGRGIELVVKDLRGEIPAFEELEAAHFPPHHLPWSLLMPIPQDLSNDQPHAACKLQFSAIEGGTILTFAMSHCVSDGTGTDAWMRILIEEVRLAQEDRSERTAAATVGLDRSVLCNMTSNLAFKIEEHPAYRFKAPPPPPAADAPASEPAPANLWAAASDIPVLLRISAAGLAQLKADATTPDAPPISTHDALCALMWRTVLLIRSRRSPEPVPPSTTSNLFMPSNARPHLPALPSPYIGNAVYQLIAGLPLGALLAPDSGLQAAALELRRAITAVTPARVASYMAFIRDPAASRFIDYQFMNGSIWTTSLAMGTCLGSGDAMYGSDWGKAFGPVVRFRLIGEPGNVVMPRLADGTAELILGVRPEEVEVLKGVEGFGKYLAR